MAATPDAIDARCPSCGSRAVHWRNRRFYDRLGPRLQGLRAWLDVVRRTFSRSERARPPGFERDRRGHTLMQPELLRRSFATYRRMQTPRHFWRCPDCGQHGGVYDADVERALAAEQQVIAQIEARQSAGDAGPVDLQELARTVRQNRRKSR